MIDFGAMVSTCIDTVSHATNTVKKVLIKYAFYKIQLYVLNGIPSYIIQNNDIIPP